MTTPLHGADQVWFAPAKESWLTDNIITRAESMRLWAMSNTLYTFPDGAFVGTKRAPNVAVAPSPVGLPRVAFESGFSESGVDLLNDMTEWLVGGNGAV
ncbi:hypothetical protein BJX76DRAFT_361920 [Aspergillus varians]